MSSVSILTMMVMTTPVSKKKLMHMTKVMMTNMLKVNGWKTIKCNKSNWLFTDFVSFTFSAEKVSLYSEGYLQCSEHSENRQKIDPDPGILTYFACI